MLWEICTGEVPWDGFEPHDIKSRVLKGESVPINKSGIPNQIGNLIKKCTMNRAADRPSFEKVVELLREAFK